MYYVIDMLKTQERGLTYTMWHKVANFLASKTGFIRAVLLEAFDKIHPNLDYELASITYWKDIHHYQQARKQFHDSDLASDLKMMPVIFEPSICTFLAGTSPKINFSKHSVILVDLISLPDTKVADYRAVWEQAKCYMQIKPGFINAHLLECTYQKSRFNFINIAEWHSCEHFKSAFHSEEFIKIADAYKAHCALFLCRQLYSL